MTSSTIQLSVSYSQIAIFDSALSQPFNDWTPAHVSQGFAWRAGSVSFRTLAEAGVHAVKIILTDHLGSPANDVARAIDVPFQIPADGMIEVASISDSVQFSLPPGTYCLRCELLNQSMDRKEIHLTFGSSDVPRFAIVRADPALAPAVPLLTNAEPAPG